MNLDAETGLYYDRARYYSPSLGRFLQNLGTPVYLFLKTYSSSRVFDFGTFGQSINVKGVGAGTYSDTN